MKVVFNRETKGLTLFLIKGRFSNGVTLEYEKVFTKHGLPLRKIADSIVDEPEKNGQRFIINSPEIAFKIIAVRLFEERDPYTASDYPHRDAISDALFSYEHLTKAGRRQCKAFLNTMLEEPSRHYQQDIDKHPFFRLLNRVYKWVPSPLVSVMDDHLPDDQTIFLFKFLAKQFSAANSKCERKNIDMESQDLAYKYEPFKRNFDSSLIHACWVASPAVVRLMIQMSPQQLNRRHLRGLNKLRSIELDDRRKKVTAIHAAAVRGDVEVLQILLEQGSDVTLTDHLGETPLHLAQNPACVRLLIKAGANIHAVNFAGATPLHAACDSPFHLVAKEQTLREMTKNNVEKIRLLIQAGARVNQQDHRGNTPLHYAVRSLFKESFDNGLYTRAIIVALCDNGANPNIFNNRRTNCSDSMPPLLYLYDNEFIDGSDGRDVVLEFAKRNKDCDVFLPKLKSVLLAAQLLLRYGADPAVCSFKGETILHKLHQVNDTKAMSYFSKIMSVKALVSDQQLANPHTFWQKPQPKTERRQAKDDGAIIKRYG